MLNNLLTVTGQVATLFLMMAVGFGLGKMKKGMDSIDVSDSEAALKRTEAIIHSMTKEERANPDLMNPSRKRRIAAGAGVDISEVNRLVKQFEQGRKMMKQMSGMMGKKGKRGGFKLPF